MRKLVTAGVVVMAACLALSAVALASSVRGTNGKDRLSGTSGSDRINARGGNDRVRARGGRDRVKGGSGRDRVSGGGGNDRINGGRGADRLSGGDGDDVITGGPGPDTINGTGGDDKIDARDGAVDTVTCGDGEDVAKLDEDDVIADATEENPNGSCEHVFRGSADDEGEHSGPGGRDCPEGERGPEGSRPDGDRPHWGPGDDEEPSEES